jgi:basic membrane protein A
VQKRRIWWIAFAALAAALAFAAAGCGGGDDEGGGNDTGTAASGGGGGTGTGGTAQSGGKPIKVGLVTDIGGLNDRGFNHLAFLGLQKAESELGVKGRVLESKSNADYVPNLSSLAQQNYDLVIGVGFLMVNPMNTVAKKFPDVQFAGVDESIFLLKDKPKNFTGLLFKEQEAGYLVGYLAGLMEKQESGSKQTLSSVGGQKIPPVDRYIAGFQAGAKAADPQVKTLNGYSQDFVDQAKCKEVALNQIAQGSDVVFQVAGGCGLGALDAAKEKNVRGIGVDADQAFLGPHILTSALKKVDVAVFKTIQQAQDGSLKGGTDTIFDVAAGGVGLGKISSDVPADISSKVKQVQADIAAGKVKNIPDTVK